MLESFYCGWQGRQPGLKRCRGGGGWGEGGRRGGAFGYLASPVKGILFSDCLPSEHLGPIFHSKIVCFGHNMTRFVQSRRLKIWDPSSSATFFCAFL